MVRVLLVRGLVLLESDASGSFESDHLVLRWTQLLVGYALHKQGVIALLLVPSLSNPAVLGSSL